jgi:hypothetical protein
MACGRIAQRRSIQRHSMICCTIAAAISNKNISLTKPSEIKQRTKSSDD